MCSPTSHTMCTPRVGSSATSSGESSIREPEDHKAISRSGTYFFLWLIALTWCSTQVVMISKMFMDKNGSVPPEASVHYSLVLQVWFSVLFVIIVPVTQRATCTDPSDDRGYAPLMTAIWMTLEVEQFFVMSNIPLKSIQSIFALLVSGPNLFVDEIAPRLIPPYVTTTLLTFCFAPNSRSFCKSVEACSETVPFCRSVYGTHCGPSLEAGPSVHVQESTRSRAGFMRASVTLPLLITRSFGLASLRF